MSGSPLARLAVLVSGNGSNLQAVIDACGRGELAAEVAVVVSNNPAAHALDRASNAGIPTEVELHQGRERVEFDQGLARTVASHDVDLVILAGWNRLLGTSFLAHHQTINLHPASPGTFRGVGAIEAAYQAWRRGEITEGGVMVHYVPDEGVDNGPVVGSASVAFVDGDTAATYEQRAHQAEHRLLVESIGTVLARTDTAGGRI